MNNFNPATNHMQPLNLLAHSQPQAQHVADVTMQSPPSVSSISYLQAHTLTPQQQHLAAMGTTHTTIFDPRHLQAINGLEKSFYTGAGANVTSNNSTSGRYFTTSSSANGSGTHPNTILITNNFTPQQHTIAQQQEQQQRTSALSNNLRIVSAGAANTLPQPHLYNSIAKDLASSELLHLQQLPVAQQQQLYQHHQQLLQQRSHYASQQHLSNLLPLQSSSAHYASPSSNFPQHHNHALQQFYAPSAATADQNALTNSAPKFLPNNHAPASSLAATLTTATTAPTASTSSTVVLDRINICINNHYTDTATAASPAASSTSLSTTPSQQPSPIIPAIQHKAVVDSASGLFINPYASNDSNSNVIDEPDSTTTTPQTPPTTPENISPTMSMASTTPQSPSTTTITKISIVASNDNNIVASVAPQLPSTCVQTLVHNVESTQQQQTQLFIAPHTPPTPPTPPPPAPSTPPILPITPVAFAIGEDVLIKRADTRFYLGTIIDTEHQQFLVRFDDKSELWSAADEMRKLGGGNSSQTGQMCVSCKRSNSADVVEICERCGRGYHRNCTDETTPGSGNWMCKRCAKPMKLLKTSFCLEKKTSVCHQLPYDVDALTWDEKHRVNEEQIYCYCGKSGKFDDNMLQCCRCRNWYHTDCMRCFKKKILRGDGFFVFCCSVCNNGEEFLRRLQMNWIDFMHLTLYNLSAIKKQQTQKYHHLIKDIWPFALERRCTMPIPKAWSEMPEEEFKENIKRTLNAERFICGREVKRDPLYYALRSNGPPIIPEINIKPHDLLNDQLLTDTLKLTILKGTNENPFNDSISNKSPASVASPSTVKTKFSYNEDTEHINDVYEFRIEDEDGKFTSDDEIPIKHIMEKAKKRKTPTQAFAVNAAPHKLAQPSVKESTEIDDSNDESYNELIIPSALTSSLQKQETPVPKSEVSGVIDDSAQTKISSIKIESKQDIPPIKSSRKRKAFTLSKTYKETAAEAVHRICDSSSDENSSSSRGTSLDLIIPPPKNFLGLNNPFRMVTPKKNVTAGGDKKTVTFARRGTVVKNNIFTTTSLDFSSKLAALKSSGIFSNLSSSDLAKAAGQPRLVRTIKRRLSAKDITIGPNQEVRRRRIRRLSSNVEVISTTTINQIPSNFFPIHAKDLITTTASTFKLSSSSSSQHQITNSSNVNPSTSNTNTSSVSSSSIDSTISIPATCPAAPPPKPTHGRRLRQRPEKSSPNNSRRSSISCTSSTSNSSMLSSGAAAAVQTDTTIQDLKQSVTKYFGAVNRIESGEKFSIRAKRRLANGQIQYLIEWGGDVMTPTS